jgi:NDP-sugar pyrophosphorylase family protein
MLYRAGIWDEEAGKIIVSKDGRVTECGKHIEESRSTGEYLQLAKFGEEFAKCLQDAVLKRKAEARDGFTIDAFNDAIQSGGEAYGLPYEGIVTEIDTPEDYQGAIATWKNLI